MGAAETEVPQPGPDPVRVSIGAGPLVGVQGALASLLHAKATTATIRSQLIRVPARLARSARRLTLHLPRDWPWEPAWQRLFIAVHDPPAA